MTSDRPQLLERLLDAVRTCPPSARVAFLDGIASLDPGLRAEIEARLASPNAAPGPDAAPTAAPTVTLDAHRSAPTSAQGDHIGPYRILRLSGEGGMGVVYEAEQEKPVRRRVALKLIKWGMDSKEVLARFDTERQALAMMNHPNIASVYDAGVAPDGRPFFAMEYVPGVPITRYCDTQRLGVEERLRLFIQVCEGVQHAHHKGIIHRDLKSSNVLVSVESGAPVPKIIDFGVAKATSQRLTELTLATELGQLVGTPEYMSPEQAEMTTLDIDTRTDVYSLGVLLYELLVGVQPFGSEDLRRMGLVEMQRVLREVVPPRPSSRIRTLSHSATPTPVMQSIPAAELERHLKGDLDWITMKALEKDRTRRYETPHAFALDVSRYLDDQPVQARAPSFAYTAGKFVSRHKAGVAALAIVVLSLLVTAVLTSLSLVRATRAERQARREASRATAVTSFLQDMLGSADPSQEGRNVKVVDVLDRASARVDSSLGGEPLTEAAVRHTMAETYMALGQYQAATRQLERALEIRQRELGEADSTTLQTATDLVGAYFYMGDLERGEKLGRETLRLAIEHLGPAHDRTLEASSNLAVILTGSGRRPEGVALERRTLEAARARYGDMHETVFTLANNLAFNLTAMGEYDQAEQLYRETIANRIKAVGSSDPNTLNTEHNLAMLLYRRGRAAQAESLHRVVLAAKMRVLGPEHPLTFDSMNGLGLALLKEDKPQEASEVFEQLLKLSPSVYPATNASPFKFELHYAWCLRALGEDAKAEQGFLRAYQGLLRTVGPKHSETIRAARDLADLYESRGERAKAARYRAAAGGSAARQKG